MQDARPRKRSVTIQGHRTSVSLEPAFWQALQDAAQERETSLNGLISEIDAERGTQSGLATAVRLYLFDRVKSERDALRAALQSNHGPDTGP